MLFDLRGRRRRGIQAVYLALALLLGGGLVLFGIGGDVQGGLFDAFRENQGNASELVQERVDNAEERTRRNPRDANAYAELAEARYQLAGQSEGFDPNAADASQSFQGEAREQLVLAERAWDRHLSSPATGRTRTSRTPCRTRSWRSASPRRPSARRRSS